MSGLWCVGCKTRSLSIHVVYCGLWVRPATAKDDRGAGEDDRCDRQPQQIRQPIWRVWGDDPLVEHLDSLAQPSG